MRKYYLWNWLSTYMDETLRYQFSGKKENSVRLKHIMFLFVDHFELANKKPRLSEWMSKYPQLALKHRDADGMYPKHTWFYALDLLCEEELAQLKHLVERGFGEVELHLHHSCDTPESLKKKLYEGLPYFHKYGFMRPVADGTAGCFAFIHGNWSLNNACGDKLCGVDNEIELLMDAGCYGDFTFPALYSPAQPRMINSIYYVNKDCFKTGYFKGREAALRQSARNDEFMIFQGPLTVNWKDWRFRWHPALENGDIGRDDSHSKPVRIDVWVRKAIHVKGRPEWIFVKVFCHGGQEYATVLNEATERMFSYLENTYNDGINYRLHYVTAREAYNIVKAAEDGKDGDPGQYRDYCIPHPQKRGNRQKSTGQ